MNTEIITGRLDADETKELAKACLENMVVEEQFQLIREMCLEDQDWCDELNEHIEELKTP